MSLFVASLGSIALGVIMFGLSVFLILLVLVQRGKGGGLTGALGGPGGQSAFGSKAGDTFTVITAVSAIIWGLVCAVAMYTLGVPPLTASDDFELDDEPAAMSSDDGENTAGALDGLDLGMDDFDATMAGDAGSEDASEANADSEEADADSEAAPSDGDADSGDGDATPAEDTGEAVDLEGEDDSEAASGTPSVELNPPSDQ